MWKLNDAGLHDRPSETLHEKGSRIGREDVQDSYMQRGYTIKIQEFVQAEVLDANRAVWARLKELERCIADLRGAQPERTKLQNERSHCVSGAAYVEVLNSSLVADDVRSDDDINLENQGRDANKSRGAEPESVDVFHRLERLEQAASSQALGVRAGAVSEKYINNADEVFNAVRASDSDVRVLTLGIDALFAQDAMYELSETVWDAMLFTGLGLLSYIDAVCVIAMALVNAVVQGCFIGLVASTMLDNDFNNDRVVAELRDWRVLYAHNPDFADAFTDKPLANSVCQGSFLTMQGASQAALYNDVDDYLRSFVALPSGGVMCLLCVLLWTLTCAKECKKIYMFFVSIWTPNDCRMQSFWDMYSSSSFVAITDKPMTWIHGEMQQKNYQLSITPCRALTVTILVVLPRAAILISLAYFGCLFLTQTVQLAELILNSVALDVIMNVDELLFSIFAPPKAARILRKALPLRFARSKMYTSAQPWVFAVLVLTVLLTFGIIHLVPRIDTMHDAKSAMCDGDQNFLAVQFSQGPVVAVKTMNVEMAPIRQSYKYRAIFQRTGIDEPLTDVMTWQYLEGGIYDITRHQVSRIKAWRDRTIQDLAELPPFDPHGFSDCDDHPQPFSRAISMAFSFTIGGDHIHNCGRLEQHCFNDTSSAGMVVRLYCRHTCGGGIPDSGLFLHTSGDGVPVSCSQHMVRKLHYVPCQNTNTSQKLRNYAEGALAYFDTHLQVMYGRNQTLLSLVKQNTLTAISNQGCAFFGQPTSFTSLVSGTQYLVDFCDPKHFMLRSRRSIRPLCPLTCKCDVVLEASYRVLERLSWEVIAESQCPVPCLFMPGSARL